MSPSNDSELAKQLSTSMGSPVEEPATSSNEQLEHPANGMGLGIHPKSEDVSKAAYYSKLGLQF